MRQEQGFMAEHRAAPIPCIKKAVKGEPSRSTKEVAEIFGVARTTIITRVRRGIFPKPDFVVNYERSRPTYYWHVSTLLAEAKRRGLKIEV